MRILHSIVLDGWSAGSWYAVNMAHHLNELGHTNLFVCRPACRTRDEATRACLEIHDRLNLESKNPMDVARNLAGLRRLLDEWQPDVVCAHWGEDHAYWATVKALSRRRFTLVRIRSLDPQPPKAHPISQWLHHRQTDLVVVTNAYLRRCYIERLGLPQEKVAIIPAGIAFAEFATVFSPIRSNSGFKTARPVVGFLARFSPVKGHQYFFQAARLVAEQVRDIRLIVAGFESELKLEDIARMAEDNGVAAQTEIIGARTGPSAPIIARFDVGVVCSVYSESVSRSLLEYLATGVPPVATNVGGIPDLLGEGDFGVLVPPKASETMANEIIALLQDHKRRRNMGEAGREFIRTQRTWEKSAERFAQALEIIADSIIKGR